MLCRLRKRCMCCLARLRSGCMCQLDTCSHFLKPCFHRGTKAAVETAAVMAEMVEVGAVVMAAEAKVERPVAMAAASRAAAAPAVRAAEAKGAAAWAVGRAREVVAEAARAPAMEVKVMEAQAVGQAREARREESSDGADRNPRRQSWCHVAASWRSER